MINTVKKKQGKGTRFSISQKLEIIEKFQKPNPPSKCKLAREYNVTEKSIRYILLNSEAIKKTADSMDMKRREITTKTSIPKFPEIEDPLFNWIESLRKSKIDLTDNIIIAQAKEIASKLNLQESFKASSGWYQKFKVRRGLASILSHSNGFEENSQEIPSDIADFHSIIMPYDPKHVYNVGKAGLFFRLLPNYSVLFPSKNSLSDKINKKLYSRASVVICCNSTGIDRIPITMISKSHSPVCIREKRWPLPYYQQNNALVDEATFSKWFEEIFCAHIRQITDEKVLLVLSEAFGHQKDFEKDNIRVVSLPKNLLSLKLPMDIGIISDFKKNYKYRLMKDINYYYKLPKDIKDQRKVIMKKMKRNAAGIQFGKPAHLLDAAKYCVAAWNDLSPESLKNYFVRSNAIPQFKQTNLQEIEQEIPLIQGFFKMLKECNLPLNYQDESSFLVDIENFLSLDDENSEFYQQSIKEDIENKILGQDETPDSTEDETEPNSLSQDEDPDQILPPTSLNSVLEVAMELSSRIRQLQPTPNFDKSEIEACKIAVDNVCNMLQKH